MHGPDRKERTLYWLSKTVSERLAAMCELNRNRQILLGIDPDAPTGRWVAVKVRRPNLRSRSVAQ